VPSDVLRNPDFAFATATEEQWSSVLLQDSIELPGGLYLLAGARYDHVREWLDTAAGFPLTESGGDLRWDNAFKRRAGALWNVLSPVSLYANYTEDFGISTGIYRGAAGNSGMLLPPESAHEWEIGLKTALFDGAAQASVAWYDLTKINIPEPAVNALLAAEGFRSVTGAARTRGLELDFQGDITPNWRLTASYAYTASRILEDAGTSLDVNGNPIADSGNTGRQLYGVPRHGGSLWLTYRPVWYPLRGLKLGMGVVARTQRQGDNANDYHLPAFSRWRALAAYNWQCADARITAQLNVDNLFNAHSFESVSGTASVVPAAPRRWLATMRVEF
jgi:iron complex outermembrane receptor protein